MSDNTHLCLKAHREDLAAIYLVIMYASYDDDALALLNSVNIIRYKNNIRTSIQRKPYTTQIGTHFEDESVI